MDLQKVRVLLFMGITFLGVMLYGAWQKEHAQFAQEAVKSAPAGMDAPMAVASQMTSAKSDIPTLHAGVQPEHIEDTSGRLVEVSTEALSIKIDRRGGDIVYAALLDYPLEQSEPEAPFVLLDSSVDRLYLAQSGLIGDMAPDAPNEGRGVYETAEVENHIDGSVSVKLVWDAPSGDARVTKQFQFPSHGYLVDVSYRVDNLGDNPWTATPYFQFKRTPTEKKKTGMLGLQTFQGAAISTPEKRYQKLSYEKMKDKPVNKTVEGGWAAMVEHYFLSAWVPLQDAHLRYFSRGDQHNHYYVGFVAEPIDVKPKESQTARAQLYLGPEITDELRQIAPGLELTVDYGVLWPISQLLFWFLKHAHDLLGNWGFSIIAVTMLVKLAFYRLSAASYRSMGNMRKLQPRINQLKADCGEDKQRFSQEVMELYRREKINPLGGCLPILIQIPVFIALYYVLLESVELRHAPFVLWIQDLSAHDPYYVLPILMGLSMLLQQRLNPAPPDPIQARVMMLMPIVFTVLFMNFPAGLVLYWFMNNLLSMLQQWVIMRKIERA
ncbi:MAG: membrane protein insertase YidC [Legionellales bacterium]|nr:membrane protein insertase YidC [Legionellales bacterium]